MPPRKKKEEQDKPVSTQTMQPEADPAAASTQPEADPAAASTQPEADPAAASTKPEPEEKVVGVKVKKGEIAVQAVLGPLVHPFANIWIHTDRPSVVPKDSWTNSQIDAKLVQVIK